MENNIKRNRVGEYRVLVLGMGESMREREREREIESEYSMQGIMGTGINSCFMFFFSYVACFFVLVTGSRFVLSYQTTLDYIV